MIVDRCVCHDVTYEKLLAHAKRTGCDLRGLREEFGCSGSCGMCRPYIELALKTGRVRFDAEEYRFLSVEPDRP